MAEQLKYKKVVNSPEATDADSNIIYLKSNGSELSIGMLDTTAGKVITTESSTEEPFDPFMFSGVTYGN